MADNEIDTRIVLLENVATSARVYRETSKAFYEREEREGRIHGISPRVAHALRDMMAALDALDEHGDRDA